MITEYGIPSDFVRKSTASLQIKISTAQLNFSNRNVTRALLRLERTMNLLEGGKGGWGREGGEGTEGGWGGDVGERGRVGREGG